MGSGQTFDLFTQDFGVSHEDGYRLTFAALAGCQAIGLLFYSQAPNPLQPKAG
jgi:hypothetical protein